MLDLFAKKKRIIGLDIGSSALKIAEVLDTAKGRVLASYAQIPLPKGVIVDGIIVDAAVLTEKLRYLCKPFRGGRRVVVASLSGHAVIIKKAVFPVLDEKELRELIHDEAGKYLPFDNLDDVNYDFQILGPHEMNPHQMNVLIVAAKKEVVEAYSAAIAAVDLPVAIMDVDSFALETLYEENYDYGDDDVAILINIGASITNINVVKGGTSIFTRDFMLGGNSISEAIQQKLNVPFEEAERLKIEGPGGDEMSRQDFQKSLVAFAEPLCQEIERSVEYFRSTYGAEEAKLVLLAGGGAKLTGLAGALALRLGTATEIVRPFQRIGYNKRAFEDQTIEEMGPTAAVVIGLALRREGDKP